MFDEREDGAVETSGAEAIAETEKAILVLMSDGSKHWVPKSQLHDDSEVYQDEDKGTLVVSDWWANKAGLL